MCLLVVTMQVRHSGGGVVEHLAGPGHCSTVATGVKLFQSETQLLLGPNIVKTCELHLPTLYPVFYII